MANGGQGESATRRARAALATNSNANTNRISAERSTTTMTKVRRAMRSDKWPDQRRHVHTLTRDVVFAALEYLAVCEGDTSLSTESDYRDALLDATKQLSDRLQPNSVLRRRP